MSRPGRASGSLEGAIVPHAPLLLEGVGGPDPHPEVAAVRDAAAALAVDDADLLVVLSPHGPRAGVYRNCRGDLSGFGVRGVAIERATDDTAAGELASRWEAPLFDDGVDHGVLVPLELMGRDHTPVVAACLGETIDADFESRVAGFTAALLGLTPSRRIFLVASVNSSAGLTPRAPLTELPGALEVELELPTILERDPGGLAGLAVRLAEVGKSCGRGPLAAFGEIFSERPARVAAHVWPFGVGYLVASVGAAP